MPNRLSIVACVLLPLVLAAGPVRADSEHEFGDFELKMLWDGGVVPFLYAPILGLGAVELFAEPPNEPRFFSETEGGKPSKIDGEIPGWTLWIAGSGLSALVLSEGNDARWFHVKGFLQSMAMTGFVTVSLKNVFGRHRPDFVLGEDNPTISRESFPSGHSSQTLAVATYAGLYLRTRLFNRWRPEGGFAWWEVPAYAVLLSAAVLVPASRVHDNRHHVSDVLVGSSLGLASSLLFFFWQDHRFESERDGAAAPSMVISPMGRGLQFHMQF